jgi:hypothetical protein
MGYNIDMSENEANEGAAGAAEREPFPAEAIRRALLAAAMAAYEDAGIQGLCAEGRWECAIQAMRGLDLTPLLAPLPPKKHRAEAD